MKDGLFRLIPKKILEQKLDEIDVDLDILLDKEFRSFIRLIDRRGEFDLTVVDFYDAKDVLDALEPLENRREKKTHEKLTRERLEEILISYISFDLESADVSYVREVLCDICGCTDAELESLGLDLREE